MVCHFFFSIRRGQNLTFEGSHRVLGNPHLAMWSPCRVSGYWWRSVACVAGLPAGVEWWGGRRPEHKGKCDALHRLKYWAGRPGRGDPPTLVLFCERETNLLPHLPWISFSMTAIITVVSLRRCTPLSAVGTFHPPRTLICRPSKRYFCSQPIRYRIILHSLCCPYNHWFIYHGKLDQSTY